MTDVTLMRWAPQHLPLLIEANTAPMTRYLGGPESDEGIRERHERYLRLNAAHEAWMYAILVEDTPVGGIGFWPVDHDGEAAYEAGWNVLPSWQGQGVARAALNALVRIASQEAPPRGRLFAYPSVENVASNALCQSIGFDDRGERDFPFRGTVLRTRAWVLNLR